MLVEFFWRNGWPGVAGAWIGLMAFVAHGVFNAWLKLRLNAWYAEFYDLMQTQSHATEAASGDEPSGNLLSANGEYLLTQRRAVQTLLRQFCAIVAPVVVIPPAARYISSRWTYAWRVCLIRAYLDLWNPAVVTIEGAAQRLHEDTQRFSDGVYTCVTMLLDSVMTLVTFSPLLYELGTQISAPFGDAPDWWLLAVAVCGAVGGVGISALVGCHLVTLEVKNQLVEAELRTRLVVLAERPEDAPPAPFSTAFSGQLRELWINYSRLFREFVLMNTWLSLFDQTWAIVPYVLCAPRLFDADASHRITLGTLVQASNAFGKVFDSLAVVSSNWAAINAFRSVVRRLGEYEQKAYDGCSQRARLVRAAAVQTTRSAETECATELVESRVDSDLSQCSQTHNRDSTPQTQRPRRVIIRDASRDSDYV